MKRFLSVLIATNMVIGMTGFSNTFASDLSEMEIQENEVTSGQAFEISQENVQNENIENSLNDEIEASADVDTFLEKEDFNVKLADNAISYAVEGGNIYFDTSTGTITDCDSNVTKAVIPNKIEGVSVTSIGNSAFEWCSNLTSIEIPSGVTSIGDSAFELCRNLTSIEIPNGVTSIGDSAFEDCSSLTSIEIPSGVTSIGNYAFKYCSKLTSIKIPNGVTSIGDSAFEWCNNLTSIEIPNGVTKLNYLNGLSGLEIIKIPASVTEISNSDFSNCGSLKEIIVDENNSNYSSYNGVLYNKEKTELIYCGRGATSVDIFENTKSIGDSAFSGCSKLTSIEIPSGVTSIGDSAFYGCNNLTSIEIPNGVTKLNYLRGLIGLEIIKIPASVTEINNSDFDDCGSLKEIIVDENNPNYSSYNGVLYNKEKTELIYCERGATSVDIFENTTSIGDSAFSGCSKLTSIEIPSGVTSIGNSAFSGCNNLTNIEIPSGVTSIGDSAFLNCRRLKTLEISNGVTKIGSLKGCGSLEIIKIPASVTEINGSDFNDCGSLKEIIVDENNPNYSSYNGVLYNKDKTELIRCGCGVTSVDILESTESIGESSFANCSNLKNIVIPKNVKNIFLKKDYRDTEREEKSAFYGCENLTDIYVDEDNQNYSSYKGILYNKARTNLLYFGEGLKDIIIPSSVIEINDAPLYNIVVFSSKYNGLRLKEFNFYIKKGSFAEDIFVKNFWYNFADCTKEKWTINFGDPDETTKNEEDVKYRVVGGNIYFDKSTGVITDCDETVTKVVVPDSIGGVEVKGIGDFAFYNCDKLNNVKVSNNVTSIGNFAFYNCKEVVTVDISDSVTTVGDFAFSNCSKLRYIEIPSNIASIGEFAFRNCDRLNTIAVDADNLNYSSYQGALYDKEKTELICCGAGLTDIQVPDGVTNIADSAFWNCVELESIEIPDSVTNIAQNAFDECDKNKMTMYVNEGGYAEKYAKENGFNYDYGEYEKIFNYGDADYDGIITANDAVLIMRKVLDGGYSMPIEDRTKDFEKYIDVDKSGNLTASDVAIVLNKALGTNFEFPVEK